MINEYLYMIRKLLKAKSVDLHDHSILTGQVFASLIETSAELDRPTSLSSSEAMTIGLLHDIGKVYISDVIFNKQESLSEREWETIRLHPTWGKQFVTGTIFEKYGDFIVQHHERADGTGYPNKLKDEQIHIESHMLNIADQLASLMENRPYRRGIEDKTTLLSVLTPNVKQLFGTKTTCIFSKTIDFILLNKADSCISKQDLHHVGNYIPAAESYSL